MLKILQARLQQYMNWEFPDVQAVFRKGRGTKDQIANIHWIIEKAREFHKNIYFCFIYYAKALTVWITTNSGKFLKRWEYQTMLPVSSGTEWQKLKIGKGKEAVRHPGGGNGHYEERLIWPVRRKTGEFLGGPVVKNPPFSARDVGSIPGQGTKIPYAMGRLSPGTTTTELVCEPHLESSCASNDLHDAMKIPFATTQTQCRQTNTFLKKGMKYGYILQYGWNLKPLC